MNHKNFLIASLCFFSLAAYSQRTPLNPKEDLFKYGAKIGTNINKISGTKYEDGFNYNFQLGGFMQFNFTKKIGIQTELSFVQTKSQFAKDLGTPYNDLFYSGSQRKAKLDYLEVPLFLNINIGNSKRVKFQIGPSYGALLNQTIDSLKSNGYLYKSGELSAITGLWIQLPVVNLGLRYKVGLTDINADAIADSKTWRNQAVQIFAGVTF